jgi:hypothetical protein
MPALIRLTQSGACASCGAYAGSQDRPTCRPDVIRRFKLGYSRQAPRDSRTSAAMRDRTRFEDGVLREL